MASVLTPVLSPYVHRIKAFLSLIRRMEADDQWLYGTDVLECWHAYISLVYLFGSEGEHGYDRLSINRVLLCSTHDRALGAEARAPSDHDGVQAE